MQSIRQDKPTSPGVSDGYFHSPDGPISGDIDGFASPYSRGGCDGPDGAGQRAGVPGSQTSALENALGQFRAQGAFGNTSVAQDDPNATTYQPSGTGSTWISKGYMQDGEFIFSLKKVPTLNNINAPPIRIESEASILGGHIIDDVNDLTADFIPYFQYLQAFSVLTTGQSLVSDNRYSGAGRMLAGVPFLVRPLRAMKLKSLGVGTTGRTTANNLVEQMTMEYIVENPHVGSRIMEGMTDPR